MVDTAPKFYKFSQEASYWKILLWFAGAAILAAILVHFSDLLFGGYPGGRLGWLWSVAKTASLILLVIIGISAIRYTAYKLLGVSGFRQYMSLHSISFAVMSALLVVLTLIGSVISLSASDLVYGMFYTGLAGGVGLLETFIPMLLVGLEGFFVVAGMGYFMKDFGKALLAEFGGYIIAAFVIRIVFSIVFLF